MQVAGIMAGAARRALGRVRDLVIPPACLLCDRLVESQGGLCAACWRQCRFVERPFCEVLGTPFSYDPGPGMLSARAIAQPPPFARHRTVMLYDDGARRLVSSLKFADRSELAPWMARLMANAAREALGECQAVVPVPLHRLRLHERRYNQSAELARHVAARSGLDYLPLALERHRRTRRQVGLSAAERARNVQGAFRVPPAMSPLIEGRRVLLADDVYTTGATVAACARALNRAGARAVDVVTFAMVVAGDI